MGRSKQARPKRLAEKLRDIRLRRGLSQNQLYERLRDDSSPMYVGYIGSYETGEKVPSILTLLKYARIAGVSMEHLADDELDLPASF